MMDWLRKVVTDSRTERVIMALIVINAVTLGLETSDSIMARYGTLLTLFDRVIIAIFVVEILARFIVQRSAFFRDGWNIFDVVVVGIALAPATSAFSVLRALRVLRLLRLITAVPALQRVIGGLVGALPGMSSILLLIALVFYVSAVMAANLYGKEFPELFGTLGASLYMLFTIMTLEGWTNDVVNPIMDKPLTHGCSSSRSSSPPPFGCSTCSSASLSTPCRRNTPRGRRTWCMTRRRRWCAKLPP